MSPNDNNIRIPGYVSSGTTSADVAFSAISLRKYSRVYLEMIFIWAI